MTWDTNMLVSALILVITFAGLFTEEIHKIHRAKVALLGAGAMVLAGQYFGFYSPELALEAVDWNVILLLGAMMVIITIMAPTGGFEAIAYKLAALSRGRLFVLMALTGTVVMLISMLLDNVTTVVIFGPIIIIVCQKLKTSPVPYLIGAAILSNTGGTATLVGDPPNLMIGSAADIDFNTFFFHMWGIVAAAWLATLAGLWFVFRKNLTAGQKEIAPPEGSVIRDRYTWNVSLAVLAGMVILFLLHSRLHWDAWVVAVLGMTVLLALTHHIKINAVLVEVEIALLLFFAALFVVVGGVEHSHFLQYIGEHIRPFVETDPLMATIMLLWVSAILSAMIDNIPFTAAMIPILLGMEQSGINVTPLWWALSAGVGFGGNGTHLGASANVFMMTLSERLAEKEGDHSLAITPGLWLRKGLPVMLLTLISSTAVIWLFFDFFEKPLPR